MKRKKILSIAVPILFAFSLLTFSLIDVFAVPLSPYIMVVPEKTSDSTLTPGSTYTISLYTDYDGSDVWSWQFELTFNATVLQGVQVRNGDLITTVKDPSAVFVAGSFDNTNGMVSLSYAYFDYDTPPAPTTSGPGTLAYVDFTVVGYGNSDIELSDSTQLLNPQFAIIDAYLDPDHIGHGFFRNKYAGDIDGDLDVDYDDFLAFAASYLKTSAQPGYNPEADFDLDGDVDYDDFLAFAANYLKTFP